MLRSARELDGRDKPLIGINIGGLGFMTSVSEQDLEKAMECLANDNFEVRERSVAECSVTRNGEKGAPFRALNDAVITGGSSTRVITLDVAIDNDKVTSYVCDGLIVSTPTGSTGHSLSAGGPIVIPESGVFVISLICPHALSSRPLVIPESSRIIIHISDSRDDLKLVADGQISFPLRQDDNVEVVKSKKSIKFIHLPGHSHFSVLRHKLNWSGSSVKQP